MDLTVKFSHQALADALTARYGPNLEGAVIPITLRGLLYDGTPFEGSDRIWIVD